MPSVYIEETKGKDLFKFKGRQARLISKATRTPSKGFNIIGVKGNYPQNRIVITVHIDTKKDTPGAIDNTIGITTLLLLANLLKGYRGSYKIELVALNGEDYYSIPGQMAYIEKTKNNLKTSSLTSTSMDLE